MARQPEPRRARRPDSLAATVADLLDDYQVPLPAEVVRIVATERRGQTVAAEQLARVAAYEREDFLRTRTPPLLCSVIDRRAMAMKPRIWARGDWRLGRRIAATDAQELWQAQIARALCGEIIHSSRQPSERLTRLALEAVARVLGPVAAYLPGAPEQWEEFMSQIALKVPDHSPAGTTTEQDEAEHVLQEHEPPIPAVDLYFGAELSVMATPTKSEPMKLRLPVQGERGEPFDRVVLHRLGGDEAKTRALLAYIQGWSHFRDHQRRAPTTAEFADHWSFDLGSVRADESLFREAFPEESNPERILDLLDEGLPRSGQLVRMMGIEVVDTARTPRQAAPSPGQRWARRDGSILTISEVDGLTIIGHLNQHGTTSIWVAGRDKLLEEFTLEVPVDLWWVKFDVDVLPTELDSALNDAGVAPIRFARPSDPKPNSPRLRVGTIEAHVVADTEDSAKRQVIDALAGRTETSPDEIIACRMGER